MRDFLFRRPEIPKFKLIVLGDSGVGKTTIVSRLNNREPPLFEPTIGCAFSNLRIENSGSQNALFEIHIWDTAGQERYHSILDLYFNGVDVCLFVYDVNDDLSLARIFEIWLPRYVESKYNNNTDEDYSDKLFYLIGNKDDQLATDPMHNNALRRTLNRYGDQIRKFRMKLWTISALKNHYMEQLTTDIKESISQSLVQRKIEKTAKEGERSDIVKLVAQVNSEADAEYVAGWKNWAYSMC